MNVDELNQRWRGKLVRTEDPTRFNCGAAKDDETHNHLGCGPDDVFGGEGIVIAFRTEGGEVWLDVDWGYTWPITSSTTIEEVTR